MQETLGIIPARYASQRFPGKSLALIQDRPMIQVVYERASEVFEHLYVATDDQRIKRAVKKFGGRCVMTSPDHTSGTDRCLEAYRKIRKKSGKKFRIVVNVQGDEPLVHPSQIRELVSCFDISGTDIATLIQRVTDADAIQNPDVVKVVTDHRFRALYFSRHPIPFNRLSDGASASEVIYHKHIGIYAYRTKVLKEICGLPPSRLETSESLEQLRWLENGFRIQTRITDFRSLGVDTPEDLKKVNRILSYS